MNKRTVGIIGAFDENGVFGIGPFLPWGGNDGRSLLRLDMGRFVEITRKTIPAPGTQNVLVIGRASFEAMEWSPLPGRHTIVLSQTLTEREANAKVPAGKRVWVAKNAGQALETALRIQDCGHVFFGGGETVWLEALKGGLCNTAFITVVHCDSVAMSLHKKGDVRRLPEMIQDETFAGMQVTHDVQKDAWGTTEVELDFHEYSRV